MGQAARLELSGQMSEWRIGEQMLWQQATVVKDEQPSVDRHKTRDVSLSYWTRQISYQCCSSPSKRIRKLRLSKDVTSVTQTESCS